MLVTCLIDGMFRLYCSKVIRHFWAIVVTVGCRRHSVVSEDRDLYREHISIRKYTYLGLTRPHPLVVFTNKLHASRIWTPTVRVWCDLE